jgi:hypothetical protein
MQIFKKTSLIVAASAAFLLAACGGGGGDSSTAGTPASSTTTADTSTINTGNSTDVAKQAYAAYSAINGEARTGTAATSLIGVSIDDTTHTPNLLATSLRQVRNALSAQTPAAVVGVVTDSTQDACTSGTISRTRHIADSTLATITSGDYVTITAANCVESGETLNGSLTITFNSASGDVAHMVGAWSASMTITYSNLTITAGSLSESANGDLTLSYSQASDGSATFNTSGNSLTASVTYGSTTVSSSLSNYNYGGSVSAAGTYTFHDNLTFAGTYPRLGKVSYTIATPTDFVQTSTDVYPSQGVMKVSATDRTSLTLTVIDNAHVRIDVDANGDGVIDSSSTITWATLASLS